jgi:hypothetical protein
MNFCVKVSLEGQPGLFMNAHRESLKCKIADNWGS